ncbi:hypothetical protein HYX10_06460 [Candidatus Woesearchaeota archaeon]|nr:hypothetical protein [Candidatus Woesearchaeota archaeon]
MSKSKPDNNNIGKALNSIDDVVRAMSKPDNNNIGNAGEYFIASVLSSRGYITTMTLGRAEAYDIIAIRPDGKTIKIQVKTAWYDNHVFRLSPKDEIDKSTETYYAFVALKENKKPWDYFIVPSEIVSKSVREAHKSWLSTPGKKGQKHNESAVRLFRSKPSKYCPSWFTQDLIDSYKNSIKAIEKDEGTANVK